jgi:hypothetical protein
MMDGKVAGAYHQVLGLLSGLPGRGWWTGRRGKPVSKPAGILKPFGQPKRHWYVPGRSWFFVSLLLLFCLIYGFAFALLAPFILIPFAVPIVFLLLLVIWAMPDAKAPVKTLNFFFFAFFIGLFVWPNYLAISLPGLPWISVIRLTVFPMTLTLLYCVSVSQDFREKAGSVLNQTAPLWKALILFAVIQTISIAFSKSPAESINKYVVAQTEWTGIFFAAAFLFSKPGRATKWALCLWGIALFVGAIGIWEKHLGYVPWRNHIPSIFQIDDPSVLAFLAGSQRSYTGVHRVQAVFTTPLGLAEYMALTLPFVAHFLREEFEWKVRAAAALTIPFILYIIVLTDSRLGIVGCLATLMAFTFIWAWRRRREDKKNPFWTAIVACYPLIFCAAVASTFFVGRIRARVWGTGSAQFSTQSRSEQYHLGIPKILSHPWGYGIGQSGFALGFVDSSGFGTIDTYYLAIGLEYGVIGFLAYYGMILFALYAAGKTALSPQPLKGESALLIPISISLLNFIVIKSVFSQQDNHPLIFMVLGMLAALLWRLRNTAQSQAGRQPVARGG